MYCIPSLKKKGQYSNGLALSSRYLGLTEVGAVSDPHGLYLDLTSL